MSTFTPKADIVAKRAVLCPSCVMTLDDGLNTFGPFRFDRDQRTFTLQCALINHTLGMDPPQNQLQGRRIGGLSLCKIGTGYRFCFVWQPWCGSYGFGSEPDIARDQLNVRFTPESGHRDKLVGCRLCAKSRRAGDFISARRRLDPAILGGDYRERSWPRGARVRPRFANEDT